MHRGVVFAPRRPSKVPRMHIEFICCALVYVLGKAPQAKGFLGALCEPRAAPRAVGRRERRASSKGDLGIAACSLDARRGKAPPLKRFLARLLRVATDGPRRGPRLAQGAQKTLRLGCPFRDLYQCPTYQLYMHLRRV